MAQKPN